MSGILNWSDAVAYFGGDLEAHRKPLSTAGWSTYGLLACRSLAGDTAQVVSGDGEHAEQKLIQSSLWTTELDQALASWDIRSPPMLILVALNRSPCGDCAHQLASALHRLNDKYSLTVEKQHFLLGSLGYYHSNKDDPRVEGAPPKAYTTVRGIRKLKEAGWKLCTLGFEKGLSRRGAQFNSFLATLG